MARETIDLGLKAYRESFPRLTAISLLAPFLHLSPRRLRGMLAQDCGYAAPRQRHRFRIGVINALRWYADHLEARAEHWRRVADAEECHERQLVLWGDQCQLGSFPKRAA